ncbi:MAG: DUF3048 domain-containing protein [Candidatus Daviesbacteria bacterium]|nr:DUF3048 domain-containing protein [Candidatus Daviesbacteria bacterium]
MKSFFNNLTTIQKSLVVSILSIVLFVLFAGVSYSIFSKMSLGGSTGGLVTALPSAGAALDENPNEPKTEVCPLNGAMKTKRAKDNWVTRFPLAVMIENHTEARPQSGLSYADVVYETVAEGGITRFMAVYLCNLSDVQVGPVRSARTYFLDWLSEYNALYAHVGGANTPGPADALSQIIKYGIKDMNQFSIGFPTFWRDYQRLGRAVATEHTMYSTTQKLWEVGVKRGWVNNDQAKKWEDGFIQWKFKDDQKNVNAALPSANSINVDFWQGYGDYSVSWRFDSNCNCYKRSNGGAPHLDLDNNQQLSPKNIVVQFEKESNANDGYENNAHLLYKTTGEGRALIFQDGKVIDGKWSKLNRLARSKYTDLKGNEINFNRGQIWIQTVPEGSKVTY